MQEVVTVVEFVDHDGDNRLVVDIPDAPRNAAFLDEVVFQVTL